MERRRPVPLPPGAEASVLHIYRYDLAKGGRELWKKLAPRDPAGVVGWPPAGASWP